MRSLRGPAVRVIRTQVDEIETVTFRTASTLLDSHASGEVESFIRLSREFLVDFNPDYLFTLRADPLDDILMINGLDLGKKVILRIPSLNENFTNRGRNRVVCTTPSDFATRFCRERHGLDCTTLSSVIDWDRIRPAQHAPRFVTFANPALEKGLLVFAAIAKGLALRRPDIPLLVVESRGDAAEMMDQGVDIRSLTNVEIMPYTADPSRIWGVTRLCLMPSICLETFGRVAAEALINGVPVMGSDRGAIPEVVGDAGIILPLPPDVIKIRGYLPTSEEVKPWIDAIIRLWDDSNLYRMPGDAARLRSQRWHPNVLIDAYRDFLEGCQ